MREKKCCPETIEVVRIFNENVCTIRLPMKMYSHIYQDMKMFYQTSVECKGRDNQGAMPRRLNTAVKITFATLIVLDGIAFFETVITFAKTTEDDER